MARAILKADDAAERETDYTVGLMQDLDGDRIAASDNDCDDLFERSDHVFDVVLDEEDERLEREIFGYVAITQQPVTTEASTPPPQRKKKRLIKIDTEEDTEIQVLTDGL